MTLEWLQSWSSCDQYHVLPVVRDDVASLRRNFDAAALVAIIGLPDVESFAVCLFVFRHTGEGA